MKLLISLLLTSFCSFTLAFGGGGSAGGSGNTITRDQLLKLNRQYFVDMSSIEMQGQSISVAAVCVDKDLARTIEPIKSQSEFILSVSNGRDKVLRVDTQEEMLTAPLVQEDVNCVEYKKGFCVRFEHTQKKLKTVFDMDVHDVPRGEKSFGKLLYKVKYQLPNCQEY